MTTILADAHLGVMVSDTGASDGDRQWLNHRKVWRISNQLVGFAGPVEEAERYLKWLKGGMVGPVPPFSKSYALILGPSGLWVCSGSTIPLPVLSGREAIGSGAKAAIAAYDALNWEHPKKAVQIACRHDAGSRPPVRVYRL